MNTMSIKKGDTVVVLSGKDKGKQGTVTRPYKVKAEYRDRFGRKHKLTAEGFFARAVCHELDHLDGILYTDRAEEIYDLPAEGK